MGSGMEGGKALQKAADMEQTVTKEENQRMGCQESQKRNGGGAGLSR